jgi:hypothetical protein
LKSASREKYEKQDKALNMKIFTSFTKSRRSTPLFVVWSFVTFLVISISAIPLQAQEDTPDPEGAPPNFLQAVYAFYSTKGAIPCRAFIGDQSDLEKDNLLGVKKEHEWVSWVGPKHLVSGTPLGRPQKSKPAGNLHIARTDFTVGLTRNSKISPTALLARSNNDPGPYPEGSITPRDFFQFSIEHQSYNPGDKFFILPVINDSTGLVGAWVVFSAEKSNITLAQTVPFVFSSNLDPTLNFPGLNGLPITTEELVLLQRARSREKFWYGTREKTNQLQTPYRHIVRFKNKEMYQHERKYSNGSWIIDRESPPKKVTLKDIDTEFHTEETCRVKSVYTPEHFTTFANHFQGNLSSLCSESEIRARLNDPQSARAPWCIAELIHQDKVGIEVHNALQSALRWLPVRDTAERIVDCQENGSKMCWSMAAASLFGDAALLAPIVRVAAGGVAAFAPARITEAARANLTHVVPKQVRDVMTKTYGYTASDAFGVVTVPLDVANAVIDASNSEVAGSLGYLVGAGLNIVFMKPLPIVPAGAPAGTKSNVRAPSIGLAEQQTVKKASDCKLPVTVAARGNSQCVKKTARQVIDEATEDKRKVIAEFGNNFRDAVNENTKFYRVIDDRELGKLRHEGRLNNVLIEEVLERGLPGVRLRNPNAHDWVDEMIALGHPEEFIVSELTLHQTHILMHLAEVSDGRLRLRTNFGTTSAGSMAPVIPTSAFGPAKSYLEGLKSRSDRFMVKFKSGGKKMTGNPSIDETEYLIPIGYELEDVEYIARYLTDDPLNTTGQFVYTSASGWTSDISFCYSSKKTDQIMSMRVFGERVGGLARGLRKQAAKRNVDLGAEFESFYQESLSLQWEANRHSEIFSFNDIYPRLIAAEEKLRRYYSLLNGTP